MKIKCPTGCGAIARTIYVQGTGAGRAWEKLEGVVYCPAEKALVRISDHRRLPTA